MLRTAAALLRNVVRRCAADGSYATAFLLRLSLPIQRQRRPFEALGRQRLLDLVEILPTAVFCDDPIGLQRVGGLWTGT